MKVETNRSNDNNHYQQHQHQVSPKPGQAHIGDFGARSARKRSFAALSPARQMRAI